MTRQPNNPIIERASGEETKLRPVWIYHVEILVSALFFALSTLLAKFLIFRSITVGTITFFRFAIGLVILLLYIAVTRTFVYPQKPIILILRGLSNLLAVYLFYWAIKYTTITNATLLSLTSLIFVALLSPLFLSERLRLREWIILVIAGVGICLVVNPTFQKVNLGDLIGIGSGIAGAMAVIMLCFARRSDHTLTVLVFLLGTGSVMTWPAILKEDFSRYSPRLWLLLIACGATGVAAQFAITHAFKQLTAVAGSITGTARVVIAAALGYCFLAEVPSWNVIVGSIVLFTAIYFLAAGGEPAQYEMMIRIRRET